MVFCTVEAFGKKMTAQLPCLDFRNKAITNPDAMSVNTAMQRCLAKAIALHGLGLYIYTGEDLPQEDVVQAPKAVTPNAGALDGFSKDELDILSGMAEDIKKFVSVGKMIDAKDIWNRLTNEEKTALWSFLDSKTRSTFKKA
jgi:hypothetical protein